MNVRELNLKSVVLRVQGDAAYAMCTSRAEIRRIRAKN